MPHSTPSRPFHACRLVDGLVLVWGISGLLGGTCAEAQTHEDVAHIEVGAHDEAVKWTPDQRLDAIRRALVKASLQGATKVETISWIDETGALRDSASFRSDMRVRGVQVLSYTQNEEGEPEAKLDLPAETATREDLVKAKPTVRESCPQPVPGLRQVVGLDVVLSERWQSSELGVAKRLVNWTVRDLSPVDQPWVLVQRPQPPKNSYETALLSTPLDQATWRARLGLTPLSTGKVSLAAPETADADAARTPLAQWTGNPSSPATNAVEYPSMQVQWQWQVARTATGVPLLQESGVLDVVVQKPDWSPWEADPLSQPPLQKMLSVWVGEMQKALSCEWMQAEVTQVQGQEINLNQGSVAGVKVGDQWLVADLTKLALHTLEPDTLARTVLAEVRQVFPYSARLQVVAGQVQRVQTHWQAWPAQAVTDVEVQVAPHQH
jgi:hypothetical protein